MGVPLNALRPWAGRELAEGLSDATITAEDVIGSFGDEESYALLRQIIRVPKFRDRRQELAAGFADYWEQRLDTEFDALVDKHRVGSLVELIIFARGAAAAGMLDARVNDFDSYLRLADEFVYFRDWVGREVTYEIAFRSSEFATAVSAEVHTRFADEVRASRTGVRYETEDLEARQVSSEVRREFLLDSLLQLNLPTTDNAE